MKTKHQNRLQNETVNVAPAGIACLGRLWRVWLLIACVGVLGIGFVMTRGRAVGRSEEGLWMQTEQMTQRLHERGEIPARARVFRLDEALLAQMLANTADGNEKDREEKHRLLTLPMPDETLQRFRVEEAPVMKAELAARFPEIKTYRGWGVDNPALTMRCDWSPAGFHAMVTDGAELIAIHPVSRDDREHYVSYAARDYRTAVEEARCLVNEAKVRRRVTPSAAVNSSVGTQFRDYDIAIATTGEYLAAYGGTPTAVMSSLATWVNGLNLIYDRELAIGFNLVLGNEQLIYPNAATDPFTNGDADAMVNEVRSVLRDRIGAGNYDLGLVLGTPTASSAGYGSAYVGVVCETAADSFGPFKGGGAVLVTGESGNPASTSLMAHELGHQFGATHTQNANCGSRVGDTAFESGGGLTLMSNAGGCEGNEIATGRSAHFHSGSFEQIVGFLNVLGGSCAVLSDSFNTPPTVNGGADYVIPKQTPFTLTATGSDADGDALSYSWEQADAGGAGFANPPYNDAGDPNTTTRPIFRPFDPVAVSVRTFPSLSHILSGQNAGEFETLPQVGRAIHFRVTARALTGSQSTGGTANDSVRIEVDGVAGPFRVSSHNGASTLDGGSLQNVTWDVSGTNAAHFNSPNVKITLSTDGGNTFPIELAATTENNGLKQVRIPNISATNVRLKVESLGNIFFDISDANLAIAPNCSNSLIDPISQSFASGGGAGAVSLTAGQGCNWTATSNASWIAITSGGSGTGTGSAQSVGYLVASNPNTTPRTGTMTLSGQTFTVTQAGVTTIGLQFYPLPAPVRLLDTRSGFPGCVTGVGTLPAGSTRTEPARTTCSTIPINATAIVGSITVIPSDPGFLTLFPSDAAPPTVANSNFKAGEITNNFFTVGLGAGDGAFKIFTSAATHAIIDVTGYYAPPGTGGLYYHPLPSPVRLVQTVAGQTGCFNPPTVTQLQGTNNPNADPALDLVVDGRGSGLPSPCNIIPNDAAVLVGNATTVSPNAPLGFGYLTIYPSDAARPTVASSNYAGNDTINGPFAVKLGVDGKFKIYTFSTTHLVIDISGYYSASANDANGTGLLFNPLPTPMRLLDTRNIPGFPLTGCYKPQTPISGGTGGIRTQQVWGTCSDQPLTIPNGARAIVGNVTVINPVSAGFGTFFPGNIGTAPTVATTNFPSPVGLYGYNRHYYAGLSPTDGTFKILTQFTSDYIVDVSGYFAP